MPAACRAVPRPGSGQPRRYRLGHQGCHRKPADAAQPVEGEPQSSRPQKAGVGTRAGDQDAEPLH